MKKKLIQLNWELNAIRRILDDLMTELDILIEELECREREDDGK